MYRMRRKSSCHILFMFCLINSVLQQCFQNIQEACESESLLHLKRKPFLWKRKKVALSTLPPQRRASLPFLLSLPASSSQPLGSLGGMKEFADVME